MATAQTREQLEAALLDRNLKALLMVIRTGEGTDDAAGYTRLVGGTDFGSLAHHPRRAVTLRIGGKEVTSTAAGAYQILARTWDEAQDALDLKDFSTYSQDLAAAWLIRRRKALDDALAGRFEAAIEKLNREWASLPGSPYGQPTMTMDRARKLYLQHGGAMSLNPPMPAAAGDRQPPPAPVEERTLPPYIEEPAMPAPLVVPILSALVPALLPKVASLIPELANIFGDRSKESSAQYVEAGVKVLETITAATGVRNAQEAVERIAQDPAAQQSAQEAVRARWFELTEVAGGIAAAREHNAAMAPLPRLGLRFHEVLSLLTVTGAYAVGSLYLFTGSPAPEMAAALVTALVIAALGSVVAYWFGSTSGSALKSELLAKK